VAVIACGVPQRACIRRQHAPRARGRRCRPAAARRRAVATRLAHGVVPRAHPGPPETRWGGQRPRQAGTCGTGGHRPLSRPSSRRSVHAVGASIPSRAVRSPPVIRARAPRPATGAGGRHALARRPQGGRRCRHWPSGTARVGRPVIVGPWGGSPHSPSQPLVSTRAHRGLPSTPVDSRATGVIPHAALPSAQAAPSTGSAPKRRTGWASSRGGTATSGASAPTTIPAAGRVTAARGGGERTGHAAGAVCGGAWAPPLSQAHQPRQGVQERRHGRTLPNGSRSTPVTTGGATSARDPPQTRAHRTIASTASHGPPPPAEQTTRGGPVPARGTAAQGHQHPHKG
jgi:hypothetical protein